MRTKPISDQAAWTALRSAGTTRTMTADNQKMGDTLAGGLGADRIAQASEFEKPGINWQFFEASPDGVKIIAPDGRLLFVNGNGLRALEAQEFSEIGDRSWIELWPDHSRAEAEAAFRRACSGHSTRFTAPRPTSKGTPRWWDVVISPIKDADGEVVSVLSISRDVTPSLALADTLRRSEQKFQALANNIAQLAWMADPSGEVFWYNQRWLDYTGSTIETSLGQGWRVFHHPDHIARVVEKFTLCIAEGRVWEDLFPLRGADGAYRWFLSRAMPVRNASGEIELWCGTNTDVTDHRKQSQRLRQLARIIELSHEAMLVRHVGGRIVLWNRGCEELFGYTKSQVLAQSSFDLLRPRNIDPPQEFDDALQATGSWTGEIQYTASDGLDVWVDSRQELIKIGDRNLVLETSRDITERRQADEVRSLLVAELNHRVKNTLAVVQSIASQAARTSPTPAKFVTSFNGRLQALASAHNVLSEVAWSGAPIIDLIKSQISAMGAEGDRIACSGEPVDLQPQTALQLALILHELAANALQHGALSTPGGRIAISWRIIEGPPRSVELSWREMGGPPVLEPQRRGFGLTLIERSRSLPNLKTTMTFEPDGVVAHVVLEARKAGSSSAYFNPGKGLSRARPAAAKRPRVAQKRVLIMNGSPSRALLIEDMLDNAGYAVAGAIASAEGAAAQAVAAGVDLVALDIDEFGYRDVERLTADLGAHGIPCIALGSPARLAQIKAGSFAAIVAKPTEREAFLKAVTSSLPDDRFDDDLIL
jgi:PAS domain S-box-containing protein